jgi:REP element-mobilizing transposase RayT
MSRDKLLKGRVSLAHQAYHVTICAYDRASLFENFTDGRLLVAQMRKLHEDGIVNSLAWVIMPDHLHWLFQLGEKMTLSAAMKRFKARSAQAFNRYHGHHEEIWQKGYYDHALRAEEDIKGIARYIVANPLRAGLVKKIGDYPLWDAIWIGN